MNSIFTFPSHGEGEVIPAERHVYMYGGGGVKIQLRAILTSFPDGVSG